MNRSSCRKMKWMARMVSVALIAVSLRAAVAAENGSASVDKKNEAIETASSETRSAIAELRRELAEQQKILASQQKEIEMLRQWVRENRASASGAVPAPESKTQMVPDSHVPPGTHVAGDMGSTTPIPPALPVALPQSVAPTARKEAGQEAGPLSLRIGSSYITPVGFMDLTGIWRGSAPGSGIGTNFGSIPFRNTIQGNLKEFRLSAQNSRIGSRVDANVHGAHVIGYWESDFLGFVPVNAPVSSNSYSFRLRLYWADVRKDKWEIMAGQSWSMITPGRKGISPLPGDLFYSQDIDVNYQVGLPWSRDPQVRFVLHPNETVAMGVSFENPEQYIGGSAGGGLVTLPVALATPLASQLNNGGTALSVPNYAPDIVAKISFDPKFPGGRGFHFEIGGVVRTFKIYNPTDSRTNSATGGGGQVNLNVELFKGFRALTNNYFSDGGGRYLFGQAPDLIVHPDGSLSAVHSYSSVSGFEFTAKNTLLYAYYGGVYIGRNSAIDANGKFVGYGHSGSPSGQNRTIQEATFGFTQIFWKDARYGALSLMGQYSHLVRTPWAVASGSPKDAQENLMFMNLRYALPGAAPSMK